MCVSGRQKATKSTYATIKPKCNQSPLPCNGNWSEENLTLLLQGLSLSASKVSATATFLIKSQRVRDETLLLHWTCYLLSPFRTVNVVRSFDSIPLAIFLIYCSENLPIKETIVRQCNNQCKEVQSKHYLTPIHQHQWSTDVTIVSNTNSPKCLCWQCCCFKNASD